MGFFTFKEKGNKGPPLKDSRWNLARLTFAQRGLRQRRTRIEHFWRMEEGKRGKKRPALTGVSGGPLA